MITGHVWRPAPTIPAIRTGRRGGSPIPAGGCFWLGKCGRPQDDHITTPDYRAGRGER